MIDEAIRPLAEDESILMGSLKAEIRDETEMNNPNVVKVVVDGNDFALYFSRYPIPYFRDASPLSLLTGRFKHIGIYVYRREFLLKYAQMPQTPLEEAEKLEQLRALENGYRIKVPTTRLQSIGVDTEEDFAAVTQLTRSPYLLVGFPGSPIKSAKELVAYAKARPGKLNIGATNIGSGTHLVAMRFLTEAGIRAESTYVPYKGVGPALLDLMAGRIDASIAGIISAGPLVRSGKLRALGVSSARRSTFLPDLPTIAEQGVPGFEAAAFEGWAAPAKTPVAVLNRLSAEAARAAKSETIAGKYRDDGAEALGSTPEEFRRFIAQEVPQWRKLVKELGITAAAE